MIIRAAIERMRDGPVYLNTTRAALHDLDALTDALTDGKLAGTGLDHFEGEALDPAHPITKRAGAGLDHFEGEALGPAHPLPSCLTWCSPPRGAQLRHRGRTHDDAGRRPDPAAVRSTAHPHPRPRGAAVTPEVPGVVIPRVLP